MLVGRWTENKASARIGNPKPAALKKQNISENADNPYFVRTRFVPVYEDILLYAEDPHSWSSVPTDNGIKKCYDLVLAQHIKKVLNPKLMKNVRTSQVGIQYCKRKDKYMFTSVHSSIFIVSFKCLYIYSPPFFLHIS